MRITFICSDTHGGVQPYVALALGLKSAGHEVCMLAPQNFARFVTAHGIRYCPLTGDVQAFLKSPEFAAVAAKGFIAVQRLAIRKASELIMQWMAEALQACSGCDVVVAGVGGYAVGESVAEKLGVRFVQAHLQPLTGTAAFSGALSPEWLSWFGGAGNRVGHALTRQIMWQPTRLAVNRARRAVLGLPEAPFWGRLGHAQGKRSGVLYGYSRHVLPRPQEWDPAIQVTGYWFLDAPPTWEPPAKLSDFLASGPPPIAVGFGSMADRDSESTARLVAEAVRTAGVRAVLLSGWGGIQAADLGPSICVVESAPHDWLFPRAALVVHHGGAGTTGAAFRAGLPSVVVPFAAEQPFWGSRVAALGCGPAPIPRPRLSAALLASAILSGLSERVRRRAAALGERVRCEDGVRDAIRFLEA